MEERLREAITSEKLRCLCYIYKVDSVCLTEVNKDCREMEQKITISNAKVKWREHRWVQVLHNTTKPQIGEFQVGSTAMIGFDEVVFKITR